LEQVELDTALEELELRLERLRALYEQYFMGLEKIEPAIARKDVDRRIYVLRREKIRNTAKRFKLQTIIQRYNTFQQYWQRICREIENGTYKRHLLKAQKNGALLTIAARKRLGRQGRLSKPPEAAAPSQPPSVPPSAQPPIRPVPITPVPAAPAPPARPPGSPPLPARPALPSRPGVAPPTAQAPAPSAAAAAAPAPIAANPPAPKPAPAKFESLDLDMDFMGDWDPGAKRAGAKPAAPTPAKVAPPPPAAAPPKPAAPPAAAAPKPTPGPPPAPIASRPASIPPAPVAVPPRPASSRPPTAPAAPRIAPARPLGAAPPPKPLARPAAAPPKPAPAAASSNADDARMRDLHARLQQAKLQTKEANVSFEGLAKSIRATEAKLREQHKNRKIDFDVVIKDGKAVVKPIIR
jgi:hypothetical protein